MDDQSRLNKACFGLVIIGIVTGALSHFFNGPFGSLLFAAVMFAISLDAFIFGALPDRAAGATDKTIARAFIIACVALAFSALQFPIWCCMAHQFPVEDFSHNQAGWVMAGVIISMFGPAAPSVVRYIRRVRALNDEQKEELRRKKEERDAL